MFEHSFSYLMGICLIGEGPENTPTNKFELLKLELKNLKPGRKKQG
jgi:hypothetical protein